MDARELKTGLWRWTAPHPEWAPGKSGADGWEQLVGSIYYEAPRTVVLIDPIEPPPGSPERERLFEALDRDVARHQGRVAILVGNRFHGRHAGAMSARYGAEIWAHADAQPHLSCPVTHGFVEGDELPGGARALNVAGLSPGEVVFHLPSVRAIVAADALVGAGRGELRVCPSSWGDPSEQGQAAYLHSLRPSLHRLLELDFDAVLVSHGAPVLDGARRALEAALAGPAWGA